MWRESSILNKYVITFELFQLKSGCQQEWDTIRYQSVYIHSCLISYSSGDVGESGGGQSSSFQLTVVY